MQQRGYNQALATFFLEKLCNEADSVYKLGYAITLGKQSAYECLRTTYASLMDRLSKLMSKNSDELRIDLLEACWASHKSKSAKGEDKSKLSTFLGTLSTDERAALIMVDGAVLLPEEAAKVIGCDEVEIRKTLAKARQALIKKFS
ncbi:MAG: hypothetical protein AB7T49_09610 [Oligoflexales bacterium]